VGYNKHFRINHDKYFSNAKAHMNGIESFVKVQWVQKKLPSASERIRVEMEQGSEYFN
jgi:hypothetical protein